mgnify:CR=1 FL=1
MQQDERDIYLITPNFIEGGTLLGGMFKTRNVVEAAILAVVIGLPIFSLELSLTARIIILCLTALPIVLVALVGIGGSSLSSFILQFISYLRNRRILSREGTSGGKGKSLLPSWPKNARLKQPRVRVRHSPKAEIDFSLTSRNERCGNSKRSSHPMKKVGH